MRKSPRLILPAILLSVIQALARIAAAASPPPGGVQPMPAPHIDDAMLVPVPPPRRLFSSWPEIAGWIHSASPDLHIAIDQVLQAEAVTRGAIAQYLPTINAAGRYQHQFITRNNGQALPVSTPAGDIAVSSIAPLPNVWDGSLRLQQNILNVSVFDQIGIGRLGEEAGRLSLEDKKRTIVLGVAGDVIAVVTAEKAA